MTPGRVAGHVHTFVGSSNIGVEVPSSEYLREANCTSSNIAEDKSAYWFPQLYFHGADGSYESVNGGHVIYYLFDGPGTTKSFPDDFRMITGNSVTAPEMGSPAQKAVSFLCLNFKGQSTRHDTLPTGRCPDGIRAQIVSATCTSLSNRLPHLFSPRTSKSAGTEKTPPLPISQLTSHILLMVPRGLNALMVSRSSSPVSSTNDTMPLRISITSATRP